MDGQQMNCAKEALQLFLRSLPACFFDIVSFGSNFQQMFGTPAQYSNDSLAQATEQVKKFQADLGTLLIFIIKYNLLNARIRWHGAFAAFKPDLPTITKRWQKNHIRINRYVILNHSY